MSKTQKETAVRRAQLRRKWIAAYEELGDAGAVCRRFGISRPTLRKWLRRFEAEGNGSLTELSRRPHRSPARKAGESESGIIIRLRRERRLGVKRLRIELERLHGIRLAVSTLHKVLAKHGLNALPRKRRVRHVPKRYSRPVPSDRVQVDSCKIRPGLWQFAAIDDCSRYLVAGLAPRRSAAVALRFLDQMFEEMPFAVQRVQTDRGTEFFAEAVQRRLMDWAVKFRPIPPRSPHLNGKVERVQRTVLEEFWATVDSRAPDIADQLSQWVHHYNWCRSHAGLGGLCPIDRVCERAGKTPLWGEVADSYNAKKERVQVREYAVEMALRKVK
ncbi:IS481 family transposase [Falsiroseomonas sp. E2-1-a4]|uniref:IS481 family transposase n=1 Tax=Falsiroseomonas sp. E2-1-a4 TaxID=3239299 RepID=UPI003F30FCAC